MLADRLALSVRYVWTGDAEERGRRFAEILDAYDEATLTRLRRAIRTYDPLGVMAIGRVLFT